MAAPRLGKDGAVYLTTDDKSSDVALVAHITDWELAALLTLDHIALHNSHIRKLSFVLPLTSITDGNSC